MDRPSLREHVAWGPERSRSRPRRQLSGGAAPAVAAPQRTPPLLRATRHWLAGVIVAAGLVAMAFGSETSLVGGAALVGAGLATWLCAWLYRVGIEGEADRIEEENARRRFTRTGRWN
jgi:hypothetical protein